MINPWSASDRACGTQSPKVDIIKYVHGAYTTPWFKYRRKLIRFSLNKKNRITNYKLYKEISTI